MCPIRTSMAPTSVSAPTRTSQVGGFDRGPAGEDQRLWDALRAGGHSTESPRSLLVVTSGRAKARATGGFADTLTALAEAS